MGCFRITVAIALLTALSARADGDGVDSDMYQDPALPTARVVKTYPDGLAALWLAALDRPGAELPGQAAQAIAAAHKAGMPGLASTVPALLRVLDRPDPHPGVRVAVVQALVALDARDTAPALLRLIDAANPDLSAVVEPALARWGYRPAAAHWLDQLNRPAPLHRSHVLAMQGLAAVREEKAIPRLQELLHADVPPPFRLEAARTLAVIRPNGWEADAAKLAADPSPSGRTGRLAAASLLRHHTGDEAVRLLQTFARDAEPAVVTVALTRLAEIDSRLVLAVLDPVLGSEDGLVRTFGVDAMASHPSAQHVRRLGDRLSDPHPEVRTKARRAMRAVAAAAEWRGPVIDRAVRTLSTTDWRGQEQAALLLGQLGHKPAAGRLVELLASDRPEVCVTAAWGLRVLAVPDTFAAALAHLNLRHRQLLTAGPTAGLRGVTPDVLDQQLSQLAQLFGRAKYREAEPTLRALIPRRWAEKPASGKSLPNSPGAAPPPPTPVGGEARAAAIWAIGLLHAGGGPADLAAALEQRLTETPPDGPDDERVRRMAAVALGRMKATAALPSLRKWAGDGRPTVDLLPTACRWAVAQVTGEPLPPPGVVEAAQRDWFLTPAR